MQHRVHAKNRFADANVVTGFHVIPDFTMEQKIWSKAAHVPRPHHKTANIEWIVQWTSERIRNSCTPNLHLLMYALAHMPLFHSSVRAIIFSHFALPTFRIETKHQEPVLFHFFFYSHWNWVECQANGSCNTAYDFGELKKAQWLAPKQQSNVANNE